MQKLRGLVILSFVCGLAIAGGAGAEETDPAGRWEGAILFQEGRTELDMVAVFDQTEKDGWTASLSLPLVGVEDLRADKTVVAGDEITLTFDLDDGQGERTIEAKVAGDAIDGHFEQGDRSYPLHLVRREASRQTAAVDVVELPPPGVEALRQQFNADQGMVRLVLLLSPS